MSVVFGAQDPGDVFVLYSSVYVCVCVCVLKLHAGSYWVTAHRKTQKEVEGDIEGWKRDQQKAKIRKEQLKYEGNFFQKWDLPVFHLKMVQVTANLSKPSHFPLTWDPSDDRTDYCTPSTDQKQT